MSTLTPLPPMRPDVETPVLRREAPRPTHRRRTVALIAGGAVVLGLAGGTAYFVAEDEATPAASTAVGVQLTTTEAERDAAMARRAPDDGLRATEAQRDAAWASRDASATPVTSPTEVERDTALTRRDLP